MKTATPPAKRTTKSTAATPVAVVTQATPPVLIQRLIDNAGGVRSLARTMRENGIVTQMNAPDLDSWTREPVNFRSIDPITKTSRLIKETKSLLPLQWLCGRMGCYFVPGKQVFAPIQGRGARTWFTASLQLHDLRRTVIRAFLQDNPTSRPEITPDEGRLIARSWSTVFGWVEGFLRSYAPDIDLPVVPNPKSPPEPSLFRTTDSWRIMDAVFEGKSRADLSESVAAPYGKMKTNAKGENRFPHKDTLDKWAQPLAGTCTTPNGGSSGSRGPLDYTLALCNATCSLEPLAWLAEKSGGHLILPPAPVIPSRSFADLLEFWERTMVELAELDATIARALLDQKIEPSELANLENEWNDVVEWMTGFVEKW